MENVDHLTEEEFAQYLDAITANIQEQLAGKILDHMADCVSCKRELLEMIDLLATDPPEDLEDTGWLC